MNVKADSRAHDATYSICPLVMEEESDNSDARESSTTDDDDEEHPSCNRNIVISCSSCCCHNNGSDNVLVVNHNVFLSMLLNVVYGISDSLLWNDAINSAYLKQIYKNNNFAVGKIVSCYGWASLFAALPVGYLADNWGRDKVLRVGGLMFILTAILHAMTMYWVGIDGPSTQQQTFWSMVLFCVVQSLWGIANCTADSPCDALFADSTPVEKRSAYYQYVWGCYNIPLILGPISIIILFRRMVNNEWDMRAIQTILYIGLTVNLVNAVIMMYFDDSKALDDDNDDDEEEEASDVTVSSRPSHNLHDTSRAEELTVPLLLEDSFTNANKKKQSIQLTPIDNEQPFHLAEDTAPHCKNQKTMDPLSAYDDDELTRELKLRQWIPYVLLTSSFLSAAGSGISDQFVPLYFKDDCGMTPTLVQIMYVIIPISMTAFSALGTHSSHCMGRVQTILIFKIIAIMLFSIIAFSNKGLRHQHLVLVVVNTLGSSIGMSVYPLLESLLMGSVQKHERGRWRSLQTLVEYGWSGTAIVGGWISDKWGYGRTFIVTCMVELLSILLFATLLPLVPKKEGALATMRTQSCLSETAVSRS